MKNVTSELISLEEALDTLLAHLIPVTERQCVALDAAAGLVTASPVISPVNVPPFANAAMDGYALCTADLANSDTLYIAGKALAGSPWQGEWLSGNCIRIMTGAPLPIGADAVVMQEETQRLGDRVRFTAPVKIGQHIRLAGEDIRQGDKVLSAGVKLGAAELPLLASLGISDVVVLRPLKVALFSTGDELCPPGQPLAQGQIYDTNRLTVRLMLEKLGCRVLDLGIIHDDPAALRTAFLRADNEADVVISTGGVSVGEADYTKAMLEELGDVTFWKLAIKPGKPFAFGRLQHSWFCGLPGNPVSAAVTFYQLVQPLLAKLSGHSGATLPRRQRVRTVSSLKKSVGRLDFQRGILTRNERDEFEVRSTGAQGSHVFSSFSQANCFIVLERQRGDVQPGEWVDVEPFNALLEG